VGRVIRSLGKDLGQLVPIGLWQRIFPEPIVCPCYHIVSNTPVRHVKHYPFLAVPQFESDLQYLKNTFPFITYDKIVEQRLRDQHIPDMSVCLTFDDGFQECASVVRPILLRHGATCIFFIITDLIDNRAVFLETQASLCADAILQHSPELVATIVSELGLVASISAALEQQNLQALPARTAELYDLFDPRLRPILVWLLTIRPSDVIPLTRLCDRLGIDVAKYVESAKPFLSTEQILQLRSDGFTIGAHSCTHPRLQELSLADAQREIIESCRVIHDLTGQQSVPFAFPYSGFGLDRNWLAELRRNYPFIGLFFDSRGFRRDAPHVVQRVFGERVEALGPLSKLLSRAWTRRLSWQQ
jgi:peptidoglycan/xylan/chitin deacetylase (PgdA/CDA1 family)